jgi:hypothetical protein
MYMYLLIRGGLSLSKIILMNMPELKRLRVIPDDGERYSIPALQYEIPEYRPDMKSSRSEEKYLRPTLYCDPNDPVVIALANKLGAFRLSDREFAEAAFHLVKERTMLDERPLNDVAETFRRGTGTCFHLIAAFIALCRCAGIKARYKVFAMKMIPTWYNVGYFVLEAEGEVMIDGEWVVANVTAEAEWQAAAGTPITRLGEDSLGVWYKEVPGTVMYMESIPYCLGASLEILHAIAPGSMERVNISIKKQKARGKAIIDEAGGLEAYDAIARGRQGPRSPKIELEGNRSIIFDD